MDTKKDKKQVKSNTEEQLKKAVEEADEYKHKYLRALADYQNYEKRVREEKEELSKAAAKGLLLRLLPFLDNLEQAEVFVKDDGLKMIREQLQKTLEAEGLKKIEVVGQEYDPHTAEAVDIVQGDRDNMVVEVVRQGYMLGDKVVRPAQVKVSKK